MDVPFYVIDHAYAKGNIEVASGTNWMLDEARETTPIARIPDPVAHTEPLPETLVLVREPLPEEPVPPTSATVFFDTGGHALKPAEKMKLDALPLGSYKVYGYADPRGAQTYNYKLSVRRADAVARYLRADGREVRELRGFGEKHQISKSRTEYSLDRRVEVKSELE